MVREISEKSVESDDDESGEGEGEVVALAKRCLELSEGGGNDKGRTLSEG